MKHLISDKCSKCFKTDPHVFHPEGPTIIENVPVKECTLLIDENQTKTTLLTLLEEVINKVRDDVYDEDTLWDITDSIKGYTDSKNEVEPADPDFIKFFVAGWWLYQNFDLSNRNSRT